MKSEIFEYGPISCGIYATEKLHNYKGGIFSQITTSAAHINHIVSIVGWGYDEESDTEYWVVRNSWGTYFGEYGFFKIKMYTDNLIIESGCNAGVPSLK